MVNGSGEECQEDFILCCDLAYDLGRIVFRAIVQNWRSSEVDTRLGEKLRMRDSLARSCRHTRQIDSRWFQYGCQNYWASGSQRYFTVENNARSCFRRFEKFLAIFLENMHLTPARTVELDHRAYYISRACNCFVFVVASRDGKISAIDREFNVQAVGENWGTIRSISVNSDGTRLAVCHENKLTIADLNGSIIFADNAPPLPLNRTWNWPEEGFEDCFFEPNNDNLWCITPLPSERWKPQFEIQVREPTNWSMTQKMVINDPVGGSEWSFHPVPGRENTVALWAAAGQDGQQAFWLTLNDELHCTIEPALEDTTPPDFSPDGTEFLFLKEHDPICRFAYPNVRELGRCLWPFDDEYDGFGCYFFYIDNQHALVSTDSTMRLFLLDVETMSLVEEVLIEDHEPRPTEEWYPNCVGEKQLCTDLSRFRGFGDTIICVYKRNPGWDVEDWKDTLLFFPTELIRKETSARFP